MIMPDKFTLDFGQLELIVIHFSDDFRGPMLTKFVKLILKIHFAHIGAMKS
jgi:hypothetical protein